MATIIEPPDKNSTLDYIVLKADINIFSLNRNVFFWSFLFDQINNQIKCRE